MGAKFVLVWVLTSVVVMFQATTASAGLVIDLAVGSSVNSIRISGNGVFASSFSGQNLDFLNFGPIFNTLPSGDNDFALSTPLRIVVTRGQSVLNRDYQTLRLSNEASSDDLVLRSISGNAFEAGDSYSIDSATTFSGNLSSVLNFTGSPQTNIGDTASFGTVTLNVTAIPEPTSLALVASIVGPCALRLVRRRRSQNCI